MGARALAVIAAALLLALVGILSWETRLTLTASSRLEAPGTAYPMAVEGSRALSLVLPERVGPARFEAGNLTLEVRCRARFDVGYYGYGATITMSDPTVAVRVRLNGETLASKAITGEGRVTVELKAPGTLEVYLVGAGESAECTVDASILGVYSVRASLRG